VSQMIWEPVRVSSSGIAGDASEAGSVMLFIGEATRFSSVRVLGRVSWVTIRC
jgi:hypothetical protein